MKVITAACVGACGLVSFAMHLPYFAWPIITDEAAYAYVAREWSRGVPLYSSSLWIERPQGIVIAYRLGTALLGDSVLGIRTWGAIWAASTAIAAAAVGWRLFGPRVGFVAGLLCALFTAMPQVEGFTANAEVFAMAPATISAYLLLTRRYGLAGICAGLATLLKPSGAPVMLLAVVWLVYQREETRRWLQFAVSAAALPFLALLHGALTSGLENYLFAVAGFRIVTRADTGWYTPIDSMGRTAIVWLPLAVLALIAVRAMAPKARVFVLVWTVSGALAVAMGGFWFWHYFMQVIPPLAVGAAVELVRLLDRRALASRLLVAGVFILPYAASAPYFGQPPAQGMWALYHRQGYSISEEVAAYIRAHSAPDESVYVAFAQSDVCYLADRRSVIPYLFRFQLAHVPGAYERLLTAVRRQEPAFILALDPPVSEVDPADAFGRALEDGYHVVVSFEGVPLYARNGDAPAIVRQQAP